MGKKCCAPGCRSNYDKEEAYTTVFKFPIDPERKNLWIRKLHREGFEPSGTAVVCIKHFEENFIIREDHFPQKDGSVLVIPRTRLTLTQDAFPSIFQNVPSYISEAVPPKRKTPEERIMEIDERSENLFKKWCSDDKINCFNSFIENFKLKMTSNWLYTSTQDKVIFFKVNVDKSPKITVSFIINLDLSVQVYYKDLKADMSTFKWLLGNEYICDKWSKFENILSNLNSFNDNFNLNEHIVLICDYMKKCFDYFEDCNDEISGLKMKFLQEQVNLLNKKKLLYSSNFVLFCAKIYFSFPSAYLLIRNSNCLTVPHPSYLRKLTHICSPTYSSETSTAYLKSKINLLKKEELLVVLMLDEIYITPSLNYKAGQLIGVTESSNTATTIQSFMISSVYSNYKEVVSLYPVRHLTADALFELTNRVLSVVHECGLLVVSLSSDNNRINRNMFTKMCGGELKSFINNPFSPGHKIFFIIDTVHIAKAIRNNWLNQSSHDQTIFFPDPYDKTILHANLHYLKKIHENEKNNIVRVAPKLSQKVLYPNSIERQNVKYALNLFHESNIVALELNSHLGEHVLETKKFLSLISDWWKVVNVKHPSKGKHLNESMSCPVQSLKDDNFLFLQKFYVWLIEWEKLYQLKADDKKKLGVPARGGMLTKETFFALKFTTNSLIEIIKYLFDTIGPSYVLLGKFQTDSLEARFGQYRQMSGGNYNVSCVQVMEAEKKLKILSLISLHSEKNGTFKIKDFDCGELTANSKVEIPQYFYNLFNSNSDVKIKDDELSVLVYISGYVGYKLSHKINCLQCISMLISDSDLELESSNVFQLLLLTDRGKLKLPQTLLIDVTVNAFQIFRKLISKDYEKLFLNFPEQKNLIIQLTIEKMEIMGLDFLDKCNCGTCILSHVEYCLSGVANIFLNDYSKVTNDKICNKNNRKLSVFTNIK